MPQMAPISWLILFIMFSIIFILFNILNYYIFIYQPTSSKLITEKVSNSMSWKW